MNNLPLISCLSYNKFIYMSEFMLAYNSIMLHIIFSFHLTFCLKVTKCTNSILIDNVAY